MVHLYCTNNTEIQRNPIVYLSASSCQKAHICLQFCLQLGVCDLTLLMSHSMTHQGCFKSPWQALCKYMMIGTVKVLVGLCHY